MKFFLCLLLLFSLTMTMYRGRSLTADPSALSTIEIPVFDPIEYLARPDVQSQIQQLAAAYGTKVQSFDFVLVTPDTS